MVMVVLIIAGVGMAIVSIETIVSGQKGFATKSESYEHPKGTAVCTNAWMRCIPPLLFWLAYFRPMMSKNSTTYGCVLNPPLLHSI